MTEKVQFHKISLQILSKLFLQTDVINRQIVIMMVLVRICYKFRKFPVRETQKFEPSLDTMGFALIYVIRKHSCNFISIAPSFWGEREECQQYNKCCKLNLGALDPRDRR